MKTVLITGVNGFVGGHLARELSENGFRVIGVGGAQGTTEKSPWVNNYQVLDLLNVRDVQKIDFHEVGGVIHLAGLAAVGPSFNSPMLYINTNVGIEINLFEAALAQNVKPRFLIISSGTLYDPKATLPLTESSATIPSSPYAVSKLGQEQMAHYYNLRGIECIIARPFNHIGPGQGLGFILPDLTQQAVEYKHDRATEILAGNLETKRDYTDVRDIARAYRLLLEKGRHGQTYNICSGKAIAGSEILKLVCKKVGIEPSIKQDQARMRPTDNPVIFGSHEKITADTGWVPEIPLEQTIEDFVTEYIEER